MKHLVVDARMINHSGIGMYLRNVLQLITPDYNVTLLGKPAVLNAMFGDIEVIPFNLAIYSVSEQLAYSNLIPQCDLYWSPHYNIPLLKIKATERVVTIHDAFHLAYYDTLSLKQKLYARFVINQAAKRSDAVITVSDFSKNEIIKYTSCDPEKIIRIYNGVKQTATVNNIKQVREHYNLPEKYLLYVGLVKPHKNLKGLLNAYLLLSNELKTRYKMVIVGKTDGMITDDQELLNWIKTNPVLSTNVVFTGFAADDDMDTLYANAAVFVFPSLYEGFGLPPLEAMLNQCPTAVADISSLKEIYQGASLYFDPLDEKDMADKLTTLLTDDQLKAELVDKGNKLVKLFTWKQSSAQHKQVFDNLLR